MKASLFALVIMPSLSGAPAAAQGTAPPIQGVTGTVATEGSRDGVKKAAGAAANGSRMRAWRTPGRNDPPRAARHFDYNAPTRAVSRSKCERT